VAARGRNWAGKCRKKAQAEKAKTFLATKREEKSSKKAEQRAEKRKRESSSMEVDSAPKKRRTASDEEVDDHEVFTESELPDFESMSISELKEIMTEKGVRFVFHFFCCL
jgi:sRNA-binding protein